MWLMSMTGIMPWKLYNKGGGDICVVVRISFLFSIIVPRKPVPAWCTWISGSPETSLMLASICSSQFQASKAAVVMIPGDYVPIYQIMISATNLVPMTRITVALDRSC